MKNFFKQHKIFCNYAVFFTFVVLNFILMLYHEPWRDEIHAWTMAKYLSLKELFIVSRFDGHPVLWHLLLMPFAKLSFPIITLNIISWLIVSVSAWFFMFKSNIHTVFKYLLLFTAPFLYIYSSISRNYCLILLFLMLISSFYERRYTFPIIYSILISLLVFTHALAWGLVAGLTITFHFYEIYQYLFKKKKNIPITKIIIGLLIIAICSIGVVLQLFGSTNSDYGASINDGGTFYATVTIIYTLLFTLLLTVILSRENIKEYLVLCIGLLFQCFVYYLFYSSVMLVRYILIFLFVLFFILLVSKTNAKKKFVNALLILYLVLFIVSGGFLKLYKSLSLDMQYPYSSAQEMAEFINANLSDQATILMDSSIICQTIVPYLKNAHLYDIVYDEYFENIKYMENDTESIYHALENIDKRKYHGYYLIVSHHRKNLNFDVVYHTKPSITGENYVLYHIN